MDFIELGRVLTEFLMPMNLSIGLAICAIILMLKGRPARAAYSLVLSLLLLVAFSLPVFAVSLVRSLESGFPPTVPATCVRSDAIVVLGGAIRPGLDVDPMSRLHRGSDRIAVAAALFDAGCAPLIFVAAGGRYELPVVESEAVSIAHFLQRLGVPSRNILIDSLSRNTAQNAEQSWAGLSGQGARDIILVTSAWHLPRAILEFESVGFSVRPFGADYRGYLSGSEPLGGWWPDAGALLLSHVALKERLGLLVQRLR